MWVRVSGENEQCGAEQSPESMTHIVSALFIKATDR
jgi:hypothetical protein